MEEIVNKEEIMKKEEPVIICPHCNDPIIIEKFNCCIFRHGILKDTGKQMDPHTVKEECDRLAKEGLIYGCGKPFKVIIDLTEENEKYIIEICEYI